MNDETNDIELDRESEEVDIEPYEGDPDFEESPTRSLEPQDDLEEDAS